MTGHLRDMSRCVPWQSGTRKTGHRGTHPLRGVPCPVPPMLVVEKLSPLTVAMALPRDGDATGPSGESAMRGSRSPNIHPREGNLESGKPCEGNPPERNMR